MNKKEVALFRKKLAPLESVELVERIKDNGTLENVKMRFYMGQEMNLKITVYVKHTGNKVEQIFTSPTNDYFVGGDDDTFIFDVIVPVFYDDEIVVKAINESNINSYDMCVDIDIDYYQGTDRVVGGVI